MNPQTLKALRLAAVTDLLVGIAIAVWGFSADTSGLKVAGIVLFLAGAAMFTWVTVTGSGDEPTTL